MPFCIGGSRLAKRLDLGKIDRISFFPPESQYAPVSPHKMEVTTFSSKIACDLIAYVHKKGHDVTCLYELLALPASYLNREDIRIPSTKMSQIWEMAMKVADDEDVGFHMGIEFHTTALRTTSLIMQSCPTVYEALEQGVKYSDLIANVLSMEIGESTDDFYVEFTPKKEWGIEPEAVVKDCLNTTFISMLVSVQRITGVFHSPSILSFSYPKPKNLTEYYRAFNCSIEFSQPYNRIGFPKDLGSVQISTRDQGLLAILEKYANEIKQSYSSDQHFASRTQKLILEMMDPQPPTLEAVAQALNLSSRSLQRKLKKERGCTYKDLVEEARKKLCAKYLEDPQRTVDEIGFLTGYADTTSFIRAFKRWYGKTPRQASL